jgi:hypothetical protein
MPIKFWSKLLEGKDCLKDLDLGGRIILKWMLKKYNVMRWAGLIWVRVWIIFQLLRREQ